MAIKAPFCPFMLYKSCLFEWCFNTALKVCVVAVLDLCPCPHLMRSRLIYSLFTHQDGFIISDKTWMHTPEALAKHYISYNAKVGETISLLLLSVKKEKERSFCLSVMLKKMSILE